MGKPPSALYCIDFMRKDSTVKYRLDGILKRTKGMDGEVYLRLCIERKEAPELLSDFCHGTGEIQSGYAGQNAKFKIEPDDDHRVVLVKFEDGGSARLSSESERSGDPNRPWRAMPLKQGRMLSLRFGDYDHYPSDDYEVSRIYAIA